MVHATPLSVSLLALPETTTGTLYSLHEVLAAAGVAWHALTSEGGGEALLTPRIVSRDGRSFLSPCGPLIVPQAQLSDIAHSDIVVVSDLQLSSHATLHGRWPEEIAWCRQQYEGDALLCSVCTGSILFAAAGLLDGLEATSHWAARDLIKCHFPRVKLLPDRVLVVTGEDGRIITSGGASSWQDLALYLISRCCGAEEAVRIAKIFLLKEHAEGQLPYTAMRRVPNHGDAVVARCQAWLADHYDEPHPVACMVRHSGLHQRTFKRRFLIATGYSPMAYVQTLRIEEAKQLLETTNLTIDEIAGQVGYEDGAFFRRLFKRTTGLTPARYRQRFQSIGKRRNFGLDAAREQEALQS